MDKSLDDQFLRALAWSGYQVGGLAKHYYRGGTEIASKDHEQAVAQTEELLQQENVILYEPAIRFENLFIRIDILVKEGNRVQLIEVKAKSYESADEFTTKAGKIKSDWKPYLYDVAFQKYVLNNSYPEFEVMSHLMLVDKTKVATVEGLNQKFFIARAEGNNIQIIPKNKDSLGERILTTENVDELIDKVWEGKHELQSEALSFEEYVSHLSDAYEQDHPIWERVRKECKFCQFRLSQPVEEGLKSGFHQCWKKMANLSDDDFERPLTIDIWDNRRCESFLGNGQYFQDQIEPDELGYINETPDKAGLQRIERQGLQILKSREKHPDYFFDKEGLLREIENIRYPLHFIDFETSIVPLPFFNGQRPYEQIAFQFSHHIIDQTGSVKHQNEWINKSPGVFPNFRFVRELKEVLSNDDGSVFRYSHHENTVLNQIHTQLNYSDEPDKKALMKWIETITHKTEGQGKKKRYLWQGERDMVDQWDLVKRFYYDPLTNGSNSLKAILLHH